MYLREFGIVGVANGISQVKFNFEVRCVCSLYSRLLDPFKNADGIWKIEVECRDASAEEIVVGSGIVTVRKRFNFDQFSAFSAFKKKERISTLLDEAISQVCEKLEWPYEHFIGIRSQAVEVQFQNKWNLRKRPLKSPDRKAEANVMCVHELDEFSAWLCIWSSSGDLINERKIIEEKPDEFLFADLLGPLKWTDKYTVTLFSKDGEMVANATSEVGSVKETPQA